jgi:prevent-host-death family protein
MRKIPATKFKEHCLSILDRVDAEGLIITKHRKPVATLMPIRPESARLVGAMKGRIQIKGDILSTHLHWDLQS